MLKIENVEIYGWDAAIRGMRNPKNSWHRSDSYWTYIEDPETHERARYEFFMGDRDLALARGLAQMGPDHGKYTRFITVTLDITAPFYFWKEFDTYKIGTVANSCSTMHTITDREIEMEDFSIEHLKPTSMPLFAQLLQLINVARVAYNSTGDKSHWWQIIQLLPSSFNQRRTVLLNYAVLRNMYHARKNHKLDEWHTFCEWIESLPYAKELIIGGV